MRRRTALGLAAILSATVLTAGIGFAGLVRAPAPAPARAVAAVPAAVHAAPAGARPAEPAEAD